MKESEPITTEITRSIAKVIDDQLDDIRSSLAQLGEQMRAVRNTLIDMQCDTLRREMTQLQMERDRERPTELDRLMKQLEEQIARERAATTDEATSKPKQ